MISGGLHRYSDPLETGSVTQRHRDALRTGNLLYSSSFCHTLTQRTPQLKFEDNQKNRGVNTIAIKVASVGYVDNRLVVDMSRLYKP